MSLPRPGPAAERLQAFLVNGDDENLGVWLMIAGDGELIVNQRVHPFEYVGHYQCRHHDHQ